MGARTLIMGVLNVTPDSFSDGGRYFDPACAVEHGVELARQGADWIDVGGESTRPGSQSVSAEEELRRVLPVIRNLRRKLRRVPISIDTTKAEVAEQALQAGANILNDISGLRFEPRLAQVAQQYRAPLILMHTRGTPETMQRMPLRVTSGARSRTAWKRPSAAPSPPGFAGRSSSSIPASASGNRAGKTMRFSPVSKTSTLPSSAAHWRVTKILRAGDCCRRRAGSFASDTARGSLLAHCGTHHDAAQRSNAAPANQLALLPTGDAAVVVAAILGGAHIVRVHDPAAILPALRVADALLAARR